MLPLYGQETHPVLDWSTYFGGSTRNNALKYVVDDDGSIWFGSLVAHDGAGVPTTSDAWQNDYYAPGADGNSYNAYVGKFSPDGEFEYGSYFGSNREDFAIRMGQDENYIYVLSYLWGRRTNGGILWPSTTNNYGLADRGGIDNDQGFYHLVKIDKNSNEPVLVTELPGTEFLYTDVSGTIRKGPISALRDIQTKDGYAYFAGRGVSRPRIETNESWAYIIHPDHTGVLIEIPKTMQPNTNPTDHAVRISDYIVAENGDFILYGGARGDGSNGDNAFLTTDNTVYTDPVGNWDMFLRRYDRDGNLIFSTLLGGVENEHISDGWQDRSTKVLEMPDGTILVSGATASSDFPYTDGTIDANSYLDIYLAAYDPQGNRLWTKSFVNGSADIPQFNMAVHPDGQQLIIYTQGNGDAPGNNYVITPNAPQPNYGGGDWDSYIAFIDPTSGNTNYGTWYGGSSSDYPRGGALKEEIEIRGNEILLAGISFGDFPTTPGATNKDYGTFLVLNGNGQVEMAARTNILIEKMYFDDDVIYAVGTNDFSGTQPTNSTINAFQPESNSPGNNRQGVITKLRRCDGQVVYQTAIGGQWQNISGSTGDYRVSNEKLMGLRQPRFVDGKVYVGVDFSGLIQPHPTTEGAYQTSWNPGVSTGGGLAFYSFDLEKEVTWEENVLIPEMQLTCTNGIAQVIDGSRVVVDPDDLPDIIRNGTESYPEQKAVYQWQIASSASGPWSDINGAVQ